MKPLLIATAAVEAATGVALLSSPSLPLSLLLGSVPDTPAGLMVGRVAGAALVSLGIACWSARNEGYGVAARGIVAAMLFYNVAVIALLGYSRIGFGLSGVAFWPALLLHAALGIWCAACILPIRRR